MTGSGTAKRSQCDKCGFPQSTCLCAWVKVQRCAVKIVILQHPKEANHAKNTAKLLQLGLTNIEVILGESAADFVDFAQMVKANPERYVLCYPNNNSIGIETVQHQAKHSQTMAKLDSIILIDASWRKALKMWHLNPWLQQLPSWHFDHPPQNQYQIRQTKQANSLSTLESVAYLLRLLYGQDCTPLLQLFAQMQAKCFINQQQNN